MDMLRQLTNCFIIIIIIIIIIYNIIIIIFKDSINGRQAVTDQKDTHRAYWAHNAKSPHHTGAATSSAHGKHITLSALAGPYPLQPAICRISARI